MSGLNRRGDRALGTCETTGKKRYPYRKDARFAARQTPGGRLSTYTCEDCGYWHVGQLPAWVVQGRGSRDSIVHRSAS